jgi:hypothetical protein
MVGQEILHRLAEVAAAAGVEEDLDDCRLHVENTPPAGAPRSGTALPRLGRTGTMMRHFREPLLG